MRQRQPGYKRFVPASVWERFCQFPNPLSQPIVEVYEASVAIIDGCGYSRLADEVEKEANNSITLRRESKDKRKIMTKTLLGDAKNGDHIKSFVRLTDVVANDNTTLLSHGPETLAGHLNAFLNIVIEITEAYNLEVVKFIGDAAIVQKQGGTELTGEYGSLVSRVACCSFEIAQQVLAATTSTLDVHIGIGASKVMGLYVGGLGRWEYFTAGDAIQQSGLALDQAQQGQVVLSPEAYSSVRDVSTLSGTLLASGSYLITEASGDMEGVSPRFAPSLPGVHFTDLQESLSAYTPRCVASAMAEGRSLDNGELRKLSVIFVKFLDVPNPSLYLSSEMFRPAEYLRLMNNAMMVIQNLLIQNEAQLRQFVVDDKGTVAIIAVGLPPMSHSDNEERAATIALALKNSPVDVAVGVSTGTSYCGIIGNSTRAEYALVGDSVVLAARLMSKALPNQVLLDLETKQRAEQFSFRCLGEKQIKGKPDPIEIFELDGVLEDEEKASPGDSAQAPVRLVGCTEQFNIATGVLSEYKAWHKNPDTAPKLSVSTILLSGTPGCGKTTMLMNLQVRASDGQVLTCTGTASPGSAGLGPLSQWAQLFVSAAVHGAGVEAKDAFTFTCTMLPELLQDMGVDSQVFPVLNDAFPKLFQETSQSVRLTLAERRSAFADVIVKLFRYLLLKRYVVVLLDEAHMFREVDWDIVRVINRELRGDVMMCIAFTAVGKEELPTLDPRLDIELKSLEKRDLYMLLNAHYELPMVDVQLVNMLWEQCQGNPTQSLLLTEKLIANGSVECMPDVGRMSVVKDLMQYETSMDDMFAKDALMKFDRLTPPQRLCLKVCAVVGRLFSAAEVQALFTFQAVKEQQRFEVSRDFVESLLRDLCGVQLLVEEDSVSPGAGDSGVYGFLFPYIRHVVYSTMPQGDRMALHRGLATWYCDTYMDMSPHHAIVGHHFLLACDYAQALCHLLEAAELAMLQHSQVEVQFILEMCAEALESSNVRQMEASFFGGRVQMMRGQLSIHTQDWAEAAQWLHKAIASFSLISKPTGLRQRFSLMRRRSTGDDDKTGGVTLRQRLENYLGYFTSLWPKLTGDGKVAAVYAAADAEDNPNPTASFNGSHVDGHFSGGRNRNESEGGWRGGVRSEGRRTGSEPRSEPKSDPRSDMGSVSRRDHDPNGSSVFGSGDFKIRDLSFTSKAKAYLDICTAQMHGVVSLADVVSQRTLEMERMTLKSIENVPSLWHELPQSRADVGVGIGDNGEDSTSSTYPVSPPRGPKTKLHKFGSSSTVARLLNANSGMGAQASEERGLDETKRSDLSNSGQGGPSAATKSWVETQDRKPLPMTFRMNERSSGVSEASSKSRSRASLFASAPSIEATGMERGALRSSAPSGAMFAAGLVNSSHSVSIPNLPPAAVAPAQRPQSPRTRMAVPSIRALNGPHFQLRKSGSVKKAELGSPLLRDPTMSPDVRSLLLRRQQLPSMAMFANNLSPRLRTSSNFSPHQRASMPSFFHHQQKQAAAVNPPSSGVVGSNVSASRAQRSFLLGSTGGGVIFEGTGSSQEDQGHRGRGGTGLFTDPSSGPNLDSSGYNLLNSSSGLQVKQQYKSVLGGVDPLLSMSSSVSAPRADDHPSGGSREQLATSNHQNHRLGFLGRSASMRPGGNW